VIGGTTQTVHTALWLVDAQGRQARVLVTAAGMLASPTWSPDGHEIAYLTGSPYGRGGTTIGVVDVTAGRDSALLSSAQAGQTLLPPGGHFTRLAWMHVLS